jgi:hypothetical protein
MSSAELPQSDRKGWLGEDFRRVCGGREFVQRPLCRGPRGHGLLLRTRRQRQLRIPCRRGGQNRWQQCGDAPTLTGLGDFLGKRRKLHPTRIRGCSEHCMQLITACNRWQINSLQANACGHALMPGNTAVRCNQPCPPKRPTALATLCNLIRRPITSFISWWVRRLQNSLRGDPRGLTAR